jgi:hypothetical protein
MNTAHAERAERVELCVWVITHTCAGWSDEQIRATSAFKELAEACPDHPLVKGNRADAIDRLEPQVAMHIAAGASAAELDSFASVRELRRLHPVSAVLRDIWGAG